jgi:hypothetical protein
MQQEIQTNGGWESDFRRSIWKGLVPLIFGVLVAAIALRDKNIIMSAIAAIAFLSGAVELYWAIREPLLTITPGTITYRAGYMGRAIEISRPEVESWKIEGKLIVINRTGQKPVKVKLSLLRGRDQPRVAEMLRAFSYAEGK